MEEGSREHKNLRTQGLKKGGIFVDLISLEPRQKEETRGIEFGFVLWRGRLN